MTLSTPRFSIIVPTRQRHETLRYTLQTCLAQNFESYEIIVCDNCSSPETAQVVEEFGSSRIHYIRSDKPLAMSDNWELALSHASGEYVTVLGDDDGLRLDALCEIDELLSALNVKLLRWRWIWYNWPSFPNAPLANLVTIPLKDESATITTKTFPDIANYKINYTLLPMIYNSVVHRDLIAELRKKTGRVFKTTNPDIYTGFAFAYLAQRYISIGRPMAIAGISGKGNGVNGIYLKDSVIFQDFQNLNTQAGLEYHRQVPGLSLIPEAIADSFLWARDYLFPEEFKSALDRKLLVENCVKAAQIKIKDEAALKTLLQALYQWLADDPSLQRYFAATYLEHPLPAPDSMTVKPKGFNDNNLYIDAATFGITDVFGVMELCEKIMNYSQNHYVWKPARHVALKSRFVAAAHSFMRGNL
jgi:hypothetical protein